MLKSITRLPARMRRTRCTSQPLMLMITTCLLFLCLEVVRGDFPGTCDTNPTRCSCIYTDTITKKKMIIDLGGISRDNGNFWFSEIRGSDGFLYFYNPCHGANLAGTCTNVVGCQNWNEEFIGLGSLSSSRFTTESGSTMIQYTLDEERGFRIMNVFLDCRPDVNPTIVTSEGDRVSYTYVFYLTGQEACAKEYTDGFEVIVSGLTPGSWMLIFGMIIIILYLVVGIVVQRFKFEKTGREIIPNYTFWVGLPALVKEGAFFLAEKIKGLRGGSGGDSYEQL